MSPTTKPLAEQLAGLARELAHEHRDWVILSEGNVSAWDGDGPAVVKASGTRMGVADASDMVEVELGELLALIDDPEAGDEDVSEVFAAVSERSAGRRPSVEALLHAVCLDLPGVHVVGHTHPVAVNALLCSPRANLLTAGSLFPDQIVVLGTRPLLVPYVDPGLRLAQRVRGMLRDSGDAPRVIYLENHGMFALGANPPDVLQITEMAVKVARVIAGSLMAEGPRFMDPNEVARIDTRPDELLRRRLLTAAIEQSTAGRD